MTPDTDTLIALAREGRIAVVPVEATDEMVAAGERAWMNRDLARDDSNPIADCYRAMVVAAPSSETRSVIATRTGSRAARYAELDNRIKAFFASNIGATRSECAAALGISRRTVWKHIDRLQGASPSPALLALAEERDRLREALADLLSICRTGGAATPARAIYDRARALTGDTP